MGKYDQKIMDFIVNGEKVGELVRRCSAEEYSKEHWALCHIRIQFNKTVKSCKNTFRTPIFTDTEKDKK